MTKVPLPAFKPSLKGATIISGPRKKPWDWKAKGKPSDALSHDSFHVEVCNKCEHGIKRGRFKESTPQSEWKTGVALESVEHLNGGLVD